MTFGGMCHTYTCDAVKSGNRNMIKRLVYTCNFVIELYAVYGNIIILS